MSIVSDRHNTVEMFWKKDIGEDGIEDWAVDIFAESGTRPSPVERERERGV